MSFAPRHPYVSAHATLRDALAHRTGTASADLLWYANSNSTAATLSRHISSLDQVATLRERFEYSNLMYMVAGEVLAQRSGTPWEQFVTSEILTPLGMARATVDLRGVVLTNLEGDMGRAALRNWLFDSYLGVHDTDSLSRYAHWSETMRKIRTMRMQLLQRRTCPWPATPDNSTAPFMGGSKCDSTPTACWSGVSRTSPSHPWHIGTMTASGYSGPPPA